MKFMSLDSSRRAESIDTHGTIVYIDGVVDLRVGSRVFMDRVSN